MQVMLIDRLRSDAAAVKCLDQIPVELDAVLYGGVGQLYKFFGRRDVEEDDARVQGYLVVDDGAGPLEFGRRRLL